MSRILLVGASLAGLCVALLNPVRAASPLELHSALRVCFDGDNNTTTPYFDMLACWFSAINLNYNWSKYEQYLCDIFKWDRLNGIDPFGYKTLTLFVWATYGDRVDPILAHQIGYF